MRMYDIIKKKRDGHELSKEEINFFIEGYTKGTIPDYQVSALMMAIYFSGMTDEETIALTRAMMYSGEVLDLSDIEGIKADKHSTGGVGDKTSLVVAPLIASCGIVMAKMSGRGLGHTGGTTDKLESIPGFRTELKTEEFKNNLRTIGISLMGQTLSLAPADKKLYALRDVTATVENMSLIASSIMSKKLAAGADVIVLDVKTGSGAFMKEYKDSKALAEKMISLGKLAGKKVAGVISDMDQPLGSAVGNALEVKEAIDTLKCVDIPGCRQLRELCLSIGSLILTLTGKAKDEKEATALLCEKLDSGAALNKFREFVRAQGGDDRVIDDTSLLPIARFSEDIKAEESGYVAGIDCMETGLCSLLLGGGRAVKEDSIDHAVGIYLEKKTGDKVKAGDTLFTIHANDERKLMEAESRMKKAYKLSKKEVKRPVLVKEIVL